MKENKKKLGKNAGMELDEAQIGNVSGGTSLKEALGKGLDAADEFVEQQGGVEKLLDKSADAIKRFLGNE